MQDALELNWTTAKRTHVAILTEMERGHTSWSDHIGVDRIRQRFTQRAVKVQGLGGSEEQQTNLMRKIAIKLRTMSIEKSCTNTHVLHATRQLSDIEKESI